MLSTLYVSYIKKMFSHAYINSSFHEHISSCGWVHKTISSCQFVSLLMHTNISCTALYLDTSTASQVPTLLSCHAHCLSSSSVRQNMLTCSAVSVKSSFSCQFFSCVCLYTHTMACTTVKVIPVLLHPALLGAASNHAHCMFSRVINKTVLLVTASTITNPAANLVQFRLCKQRVLRSTTRLALSVLHMKYPCFGAQP